MTQGGHRVANRIRFGKDFNKYGESRGQRAPKMHLSLLWGEPRGRPHLPRTGAGYFRPRKHRRSECLVSPAWVPDTPSPLLLTKTYTWAYEIEGNGGLERGKDLPGISRHTHSSRGRTEPSSGKRRAPSPAPRCLTLQYTITGPTTLTQSDSHRNLLYPSIFVPTRAKRESSMETGSTVITRRENVSLPHLCPDIP